MNDLFDILNNKGKFGMQYKQPITNDNILEIEGYIMNALESQGSLKDENGVPLKDGQRKIFVIGFCISSIAILKISKDLLRHPFEPFKYILTYRFHKISWKCILPKYIVDLVGTTTQLHCN